MTSLGQSLWQSSGNITKSTCRRSQTWLLLPEQASKHENEWCLQAWDHVHHCVLLSFLLTKFGVGSEFTLPPLYLCNICEAPTYKGFLRKNSYGIHSYKSNNHCRKNSLGFESAKIPIQFLWIKEALNAKTNQTTTKCLVFCSFTVRRHVNQNYLPFQ
jgi:hypothetical protein